MSFAAINIYKQFSMNEVIVIHILTIFLIIELHRLPLFFALVNTKRWKLALYYS